MSNCIELVQGSDHLTFHHDEIDGLGLSELIREAEAKVDKNNCVNEDVEVRLKIAWWFLSKNTTFNEHGVIINLGSGRSGHTWRDFGATFHVLSKFIKKPKTVEFSICDEGDGYKTTEHIEIDLQKGLQ